MFLKYLIIIIIFCANQDSISQNKTEIIDILNLKNDTALLNKRIRKAIKKHATLSKIQGIEIYHIFYLFFENKISTQELINKSFLNKLSPNYCVINSRFKKVKYIRTDALFCDTLGKLIGLSDERGLVPITNTNQFLGESRLVRMLHEKKITSAFYFCNLFDLMFIEEGQIYVNRKTEDKTYPLVDYVNCCLNNYVPLKLSHETLEYKK